jgi:hypothetical protein
VALAETAGRNADPVLRSATIARALRRVPTSCAGAAATACSRHVWSRPTLDVSEIKLVFSIPPHRPTPNFPPSWNVAPSDPIPVVRFDAKAGERSRLPKRISSACVRAS